MSVTVTVYLTRCVCLLSPKVLYQHQQHQHVLYQHLCHHNVISPSATGTPQQQQSERDLTMAITMAIVTRRQQHSIGMRTGNSPLASSTTLTRPLSRALPTRPSLQVQPEHHSSSNYNAIRQWQWQSQSRHIDNNTASEYRRMM